MYIQGCNFTRKPGESLKNLELENLGKKIKNLENLEYKKLKKKQEKLRTFNNFYIIGSKISI